MDALGRSLRILVVTDAWKPQMNGVVRTLGKLGGELRRLGHVVRFVTPEEFSTVPLPTYPEIKLSLGFGPKVGNLISEFAPDAIHIATEGPLGLAARHFCIEQGLSFTTAFHTRLPEYLYARTRFPLKWSYELERRFHSAAKRVMIPSRTMMDTLAEKGIENGVLWSRGVDLEHFKICSRDILGHLPRPHWLYVGRVAVEKNIEAFLELDLPGSKIVVGDGPQLTRLKATWSDAHFLGRKQGHELCQIYSSADVMVFPSETDTFGLVIIEALACGTPVAAYPVAGPVDILRGSGVGALNQDLRIACEAALGLAGPEDCRAHARTFSWDLSAKQFVDNLVDCREAVAAGVERVVADRQLAAVG